MDKKGGTKRWKHGGLPTKESFYDHPRMKSHDMETIWPYQINKI